MPLDCAGAPQDDLPQEPAALPAPEEVPWLQDALYIAKIFNASSPGVPWVHVNVRDVKYCDKPFCRT